MEHARFPHSHTSHLPLAPHAVRRDNLEEAQWLMRPKLLVALFTATIALSVLLLVHHASPLPSHEAQSTDLDPSLKPAELNPQLAPGEIAPVNQLPPRRAPPDPLSRAALRAATNRLEQLAQLRDKFDVLAAGDPTSALRAAKQVPDGTQRETALLALVTEWTRGDLRPPRERARAIDLYGVEAGLGMELSNDPQLALLWADELTEGAGRAALLRQTAIALTASDPAAAFALSEQLPDNDRQGFGDSVFAGWAEKDTAAALQWADQLTDPAERDAAVRAIRTVAPVGIGAALRVENGYAVINELLPGTPAEASGKLHAGDRIVALAQGDNGFVDARGAPLKDIVDMIRGTPGSVLQLQVLPADAPAGSAPQIIALTRDQLKFKR